jgi:hypothetical protein
MNLSLIKRLISDSGVNYISVLQFVAIAIDYCSNFNWTCFDALTSHFSE